MFSGGFRNILEGVERDVGGVEVVPRVTRSEARLDEELKEGFNLADEVEYDSEDPGSLDGSDGEVDQSPVFNPETDFDHPIRLMVGLKFPSVEVFRRSSFEGSFY